MTALAMTPAEATEPVVRPAVGLGAKLLGWGLGHIGPVFALLRALRPILRLGETVLVTRHDDVREVFLRDDAFAVPYAKKLDVIMGGKPFFLGMGDTDDYRRDRGAMETVVRRADIAARLAPAAEAAAERAVGRAAAGGRIEVVDGLMRQVTFEVLLDYFGTPAPAAGDLRVWATRLFEFQFADGGNDPALRRDVDRCAPALRAYVQGLIEARRAAGSGPDDVLGRCLTAQAEGRPGFSDDQIRCALIGFIVGGLPQPPMVGPHAMEQLLRRPQWLVAARDAALRGDDARLGAMVFEAMRFDPLGPFLSRTATRDTVIAAGTARATPVPAGSAVLVAFPSAMMDGRRVAEPARFDPDRPACDYIHFGNGLHECFGIHINHALLPLILKPLLKRANLRRAPGPEGHLRKQGVFADRLVVTFL